MVDILIRPLEKNLCLIEISWFLAQFYYRVKKKFPFAVHDNISADFQNNDAHMENSRQNLNLHVMPKKKVVKDFLRNSPEKTIHLGIFFIMGALA